ncbi:hypothetical protein PQR57_17085 [Paraburkholderia dipogonis]|uniref:Uncharacterized protein n=1 Tax=Paraburkholderia dipogonis TaxID=1211383 RepID=A0ABW9AQ79_9BURK
MSQYITNFSLSDYFGCDGGDPTSGPWAEWIDGKADFVDHSFAQFMWWHFCEAQGLYLDIEATQRKGEWLSAEAFEASVNRDLFLVESHSRMPLALADPFSFETAATSVPGDARTLARLLLAYSIWCVDQMIDGLRSNDAKKASAASSYVLRALSLTHEYREDFPEVQDRLESRKQSERARARHAADIKQEEKRFVRQCWNDWQAQAERYKSKAAFARDMLSKCSHLESTAVIEGWCRDWEDENPKPASKLRIVPGK